MAELTYNDLLSQLSDQEQDQFQGVFGSKGWLGNYQDNPNAPRVTGHSSYDKFKPIADAAAESKTLNNSFWSNLNPFGTAADAAMTTAEERAAIERGSANYMGARSPIPPATKLNFDGTEFIPNYQYSGKTGDREIFDPAFGDLTTYRTGTTGYPIQEQTIAPYAMEAASQDIPNLQRYYDPETFALTDQGIGAMDVQENIDLDELTDDLTNVRDPFVPEKLTITDEQRSGPVIESDEEQEYINQGITSPNQWQKFLSKITRQPYRPAMGGAYGYSPAQLNKMNALGGFYSEPMRQYRRDMGRIGNMWQRQAQGKKIGDQNLQNLLNQYGGAGGLSDRDLSTIGRKTFTGPGQAFEKQASKGTFTTPSGEKGYYGGRATGGYIRSGYSRGGRVGILAAF